jgi:BioD-like phosphotransacetylase family protein
MRSLYIGSTCGAAGKSLLAYGLGRIAQARGLRVGYLKPLGFNASMVEGTPVDDDALFIARALKLDEPLSLISPIVLDQPFSDWSLEADPGALLARVLEAHGRLARDKDLVIVGGAGNLVEGKMLGLDSRSIVPALDAVVLLVISYLDRSGLDAAVAAREWFGERFIGVVLNRVHPSQLHHVRDRVARYLEARGITVHGIFPSDDILEAVSVGELVRHLAARVLTRKEPDDTLVERIVVGAMNLESALKILRRARNKAVVTGGDRADIQLASLETSTRCLILTGGHPPSEIILAKAEEMDVPILLVDDDTFTTVERIEEIMGKLHPHQHEKLSRAARMIESSFDFDRLLGVLGGRS